MLEAARRELEDARPLAARLEAAEARAAGLEAALGERDARAAALRADLARLLRERGALRSLQALVAGALGGAAPGL